MQSLQSEFNSTGFCISRNLLSADDCRSLVKDFAALPPSNPLNWRKGYIASDVRFFRLGTSRAIVDRIGELLGKNIILFGGVLLHRAPGVVHPWHTDMETAMPEGGTVSVWIGLENVSRASSLHVIAGSHLLGITVQELADRKQVPRDQIDSETVERWATEMNPSCKLVIPEMMDGDAMFFDGRIWHGTINSTPKSRYALLLHYAKASVAVREGDLRQLGWPIRYIEEPRPPCILVRGGSEGSQNLVIPTPAFSREGRSRIASRCAPLRPPPHRGRKVGWDVSYLLYGCTAYLDEFSSHASCLHPGVSPHRPHRHDHEELIFVLDGLVDVILGRIGLSSRRLSAGEFVFLPSRYFHTLKNRTDRPVTYLIFKWRSQETRPGNDESPEFGLFRREAGWSNHVQGSGFQTVGIMNRPSRHLRKIQIHASRLQPGGGYEPHADAYDVALVVLSGQVESLGQTGNPHDVCFYAAGEMHGIRNTGSDVAEYLVIEFHGDTQHPVAPEK